MRLKAPTGHEHDAFRKLFENQAAWDAGHERPHKIAGIGTGGGMCCERVAAMIEAFVDFGLTHPFTSFVAVSGAGGAIGGYLSGIAHRTTKMFECLATSRFITWNPWLQIYMLDLQLLERALTGDLSPFSFDEKRIQSHPSGFYVTATLSNGDKKLLDAKKVKPHAARAVCASSAFPGTCSPVIIDNVEHYDGAVGGNPLPIEEGIALLGPCAPEERPTIIVMQSRTHPKHRQQEWNAWGWYAHVRYAAYAPRFRNNTANVDTCFASEADRLSLMRDLDWCRIAPTPEDVPLMPYTTDLGQLRKARDDTLRFMNGILSTARVARHI